MCAPSEVQDLSPDEPAQGRPGQFRGKIGTLAVLAALLGVGLLVRTQPIAATSLSFDESCSAKISTFPWSEMFDAISRDAHPPAYYIVLRAWSALVGADPVAIRWLSVLLGVGTIAAVFWVTRSVLCDAPRDGTPLAQRTVNGAALLAAALVAISPLQVGLSQEARSYALGVFLTVVSVGCLLRALRPAGKALDWCLFALTAGSLSMTHYYGLFTVAAEFLFAGAVAVVRSWHGGWSRQTKRLLAGVAISAWSVQLVWIAWLPTFELQRARANRQLWMQPVDWEQLAGVVSQTLDGEHWSMEIVNLRGILALAIWAVSVLTLLLGKCRGVRLLGICAGLPLLGAILYALAVRSILGARYLVFAHVCLLAGWALVAAHFRTRTARWAFSAVLVAWSGLGCWQLLEARRLQASFPGGRGAAAFLDQVRSRTEPVIVASPFIHPIVQQYARDKEGILARYNGNHRLDLLAGPPLREEECLSERRLLRCGRSACGL